MNLSLIISSRNQRKRLKLGLQSATRQRIGPNATSYEILVADDNSTDGTKEMVERYFKDVKFYSNPNPIDNTYTLAENWNNAAKYASGERLIFSNGDIVFTSRFIEAHADPNMKDHILLGPAMRTTPHIETFIDEETSDFYGIMNLVSENKWYTPDMRMGLIAHTYNKEEPPWHVYGYNFSLPKKFFDGVGGFPPRRYYGGEDLKISEAVVDKYHCKCLTNQNAMAFHLYHPATNVHGKKVRSDYNF